MGTFYAAIEIGDLAGQRFQRLEALVDSGSTYTWVPRDILSQLGVVPTFQREFVLADGRLVQRDMAITMSRLDGPSTGSGRGPSTGSGQGQAIPPVVVFADPGPTPLLGAYTMEGFGVTPDLINRRLVPTPGLARAAAPAPGDR